MSNLNLNPLEVYNQLRADGRALAAPSYARALTGVTDRDAHLVWRNDAGRQEVWSSPKLANMTRLGLHPAFIVNGTVVATIDDEVAQALVAGLCMLRLAERGTHASMNGHSLAKVAARHPLAAALVEESKALNDATRATVTSTRRRRHRLVLEWLLTNHLPVNQADGNLWTDPNSMAALSVDAQWDAWLLTCLYGQFVTDKELDAAFAPLRVSVGDKGWRLLRCAARDGVGRVLGDKDLEVGEVGSVAWNRTVAELKHLVSDTLGWIMAGSDRTVRRRRSLRVDSDATGDALTATFDELSGTERPAGASNEFTARWIRANLDRPTEELAVLLDALPQPLRIALARATGGDAQRRVFEVFRAASKLS